MTEVHLSGIVMTRAGEIKTEAEATTATATETAETAAAETTAITATEPEPEPEVAATETSPINNVSVSKRVRSTELAEESEAEVNRISL